MSRIEPPTHGPTGSPVVSLTFTGDPAADQERRFWEPRKPDRIVTAYCDHCGEPSGKRRLTKAEFAAAMADHRKARAEWKRTKPGEFGEGLGGASVGFHDEYWVRVTCEDGSHGSATWDGSAWQWTEWGWSTERRTG